jgi:polysaccharide deacetylase 2 family uncharacterized protein YibQ
VGIGWVVSWWLLPAFALMVFMSAQELHQPREEPVRIEGGPNWEERLHERIDLVTAALVNSSLDLSEPIETTTGSGAARHVHRSYSITFRPERQIETELAIEALRDVDAGLTLTRTALEPDGFEVKVGLDGLLTHTIRFEPLQPASGPPRMALVARGLGDDLLLARALVAIEAPIALAIRPSRPFSREVAELGRLFSREVLLDISLSSGAGDGESDPGVVPSGARLRGDLDRAMDSVPYAVGIAADVDKELSASPQRLEGFLAELNRRGLFWIGNLPNQQRLGALGTAVGVRVAVAAPPVGVENQERLEKDFAELRTQARSDGATLTFGIAAADSMHVLADAVAKCRAEGVELVPVSSLPRPVVARAAP